MRDLDWCIEHPYEAAPLSRRELTQHLLLAMRVGGELAKRNQKLEDEVASLKFEFKKFREAQEYRLTELAEKADRRDVEINDVVAEHVGTEHEGLNHGLYRDLVSRGIDPWEVVAIIRNNRGKS